MGAARCGFEPGILDQIDAPRVIHGRDIVDREVPGIGAERESKRGARAVRHELCRILGVGVRVDNIVRVGSQVQDHHPVRRLEVLSLSGTRDAGDHRNTQNEF